jgi:hypothetical protein
MYARRARPAVGAGNNSPCRVSQRTYRAVQHCSLVLDPNAHSAVKRFQAVRFAGSFHTQAIPCGVRLCSPQLTISDHARDGRKYLQRPVALESPRPTRRASVSATS